MKPPYDAAMVLGVELGADDVPTAEMARRVTAAARVYHGGACARLVLCGGRLPGHRRTEADAMARMMTALGVLEKALILLKSICQNDIHYMNNLFNSFII